MNIEEAIKALEALKAKHGNLDLCLDIEGKCADLVAITVNAEAGWVYLVSAQ